MDKVYEDSLNLHREHHGKLEVVSKISLKTKSDLSLVYTPGVGQVSVEIGKDASLAREYTIKRNTVAIVSDGSAILGLGNLGPHAAIPVMEGKAMLCKELAGVDAFPICLDTQNVEEIIQAVKWIAPVFGAINLEDISAPRCFEVLARLQKELPIPVMQDDQQGTAVVVLAGLLNALKLKNSPKETTKVVINGAGAAGISIAKLLLAYGFQDIIICDSKGIIYDGRNNLDAEKAELSKITNKEKLQGGLEDALKGADVFVGVSKPGALTPEWIKAMNPNPIIFALANPVPEIMPDEARQAGAFIVATGRSDFPNQVNNALVFPGMFRGVLDSGALQITESMLVRAAENLAAYVKSLSVESILPDVLDKEVAKVVAKAMQ